MDEAKAAEGELRRSEKKRSMSIAVSGKQSGPPYRSLVGDERRAARVRCEFVEMAWLSQFRLSDKCNGRFTLLSIGHEYFDQLSRMASMPGELCLCRLCGRKAQVAIHGLSAYSETLRHSCFAFTGGDKPSEFVYLG